MDFMKKRILAAVLCLVAIPAIGLAGTLKDMGSVGKVYEIVEPNFIDELKAMAPHIDKEELKRKLRHYQPRDMKQLPKAKRNRTFDVDMTFTLTHDIKDATGKILYPAGYKYNPMQYLPFTGGYVVIDGSDPHQVEWFEKSPYFSNTLARLLLSGGYAPVLSEKWRRPVYYLTDTIAERLRLSAVPAVVVKDGDAVSVTEVKLEE